jgi:hypothetical protein
MLLNSKNMEKLGIEVWAIGLGSTGIGGRRGHRSITDTDPTGLLSNDSDFNMLIDGVLESSDGSDTVCWLSRTSRASRSMSV